MNESQYSGLINNVSYTYSELVCVCTYIQPPATPFFFFFGLHLSSNAGPFLMNRETCGITFTLESRHVHRKVPGLLVLCVFDR